MNFIDRLIVVKVHPTRASLSIPGTEYIEVELLDPHNNYKHYHTYISDNLDNYASWKTFFDMYEPQYCYMLSGHFRRKAPGRTSTGAKKLINGDAKFYTVGTSGFIETMEFLYDELALKSTDLAYI